MDSFALMDCDNMQSDDEDNGQQEMDWDNMQSDNEDNGQQERYGDISKFSIHISNKLSKTDVEKLLKRKCKYRWEMQYLTNYKWMGTGECDLKDADVVACAAPYGLKLKLYNHWLQIYNNSTAGANNFHSSKHRHFFSLCNSYKDILHHNKKAFYHKGSNEDLSVMDAYIMHSLNHIFRSRDCVKKNDAKLGKHLSNGSEEVLSLDTYQDQGFTRPKVLILLPLASIALRFVRRLVQLTPSSNKVNVEFMDRFQKEFGVDLEEEEELREGSKPKPFDHQALFGANHNDHFMVGIKFKRKCIRLYSDFYTSDIIIASPFGLITKIGEAESDKKKDVDYLSSIEVLVVDHADVIAMQNWSQVKTVVECLNHFPTKQHDTTNIMRVRPWYLDGHAQFYRQTIILSSFLTPDMQLLFNRCCLNYEGKLKLSCEYKGVMHKVVRQVPQVYERFDYDSLVKADGARFEYFTKKVFPRINDDSIQGGIMLFISSSLEFERLARFFKSQNASFCLLGDHTKGSDVSRARNWFIQGQRKIMLYTERRHFYHRYKIRGIKNLIIYSLPERKEFYPEILNMLEGSHNMTCTVLFSKNDLYRLERIVGSDQAKRLTTSDKNVFIFMPR